MALTEDRRPSDFAIFLNQFREGWRLQANVIFALIFRQIKMRSAKDGYGLYSLVAVILEPAIGVLFLSLFFYVIKTQEIQNVHVALFIGVSYTAFAILRRSLSSIPRALKSNRSFYAFPNVKPFDTLVASFVMEFILTLIGAALLMLMLWWFLGLTLKWDGALEGLGIIGLIVVLGFGLTLCFAVYGTMYSIIGHVLGWTSRGLFFLSAVMHPVSELPPEAQQYVAWNPAAVLLELLRSYLLGTTPFSGVSLTYAVIFSISTLFFGMISYWVYRFKVIER